MNTVQNLENKIKNINERRAILSVISSLLIDMANEPHASERMIIAEVIQDALINFMKTYDNTIIA